MHLIVGGDSTIGGALSNYWAKNKISFHASTRNYDLISVQRPFIDLSQTYTLNDFYKGVVICAAMTDMATCEKTPHLTRAVNVIGTIELIEKLIQKKIHIVFLSTNQVFDGKKAFQKPYSPRNPINEYGRQKAEVEEFIENVFNVCILRITKVIHPGLKLLKKWKNSLAEGKPIYAFSDMTLSPVNIDEVVKKIDTLIGQKATGIYQLSGESDKSYFEFAQDFADRGGYSRDLVKKDSWKGKLDFAAPKYTSLLIV